MARVSGYPMERLYAQARRYLPGGVNSPVRAFRAVGGTPRFLERGEGAAVWDAEGRRYVDYVGSWGPLILGHAHPEVVEAVRDQARRGTSFGAPTVLETELAHRVCERIPSCEKVRFVSSGTEATMSALRLARAVTGRELIVKAEGCYHGHADGLLVKAGSGVMTLAIPGSPGVPEAVAARTRVVPYNDAAALEELFDREGREIACFIVEPIAGNMGVVPPVEGYLETARALTRRHGALLVFDEVITGFRVHPGGAQALYGVQPDLTCLGKVLGGGLPVGAFGGPAEIMDRLAPDGPVYQAGTLSGNPLAMRAGIATLDVLAREGVYDKLERSARRLAEGLQERFARAGVPAVLQRVGSMWTAFFSEAPVTDYASAARCDVRRFAQFFHAMLEQGVYLPPSQFEAAFVSTAHGEEEIAATLAAAERALAALA